MVGGLNSPIKKRLVINGNYIIQISNGIHARFVIHSLSARAYAPVKMESMCILSTYFLLYVIKSHRERIVG